MILISEERGEYDVISDQGVLLQSGSEDDALALLISLYPRDNINQLLESEGCTITEYRVADISKGGSLADRAFAILKETDKPWYYRELAEKLRGIGVHISGNDRAANLLAHIGRDERFQRVKRGTYGLTEWQIKILDKRRPGRSKEKESPQSSNNEEPGQRQQ